MSARGLLLCALAAGALAAQDAPPVVLEDCALARMRVEHASRAEAVFHNRTSAPRALRARFVATTDGGEERASPWEERALPPGRWLSAKLLATECPTFQAWRVELEVDGQAYRYTGDSPEAAPALQLPDGFSAPEEPGSPDGVRVGVRCGWSETSAPGPNGEDQWMFLVRLELAGVEDLEGLKGQVEVLARNAGKKIGRGKGRIERKILRRDARTIDWARVKPGDLAYDPDARCLVLALVRAEFPEELDMRLDVELELRKGAEGTWSFEGLGPPYRNDLAPPTGD
ncbi:MAG: hypothetical protein R3F62_21625 [Planctomycetota bacterium]